MALQTHERTSVDALLHAHSHLFALPLLRRGDARMDAHRKVMTDLRFNVEGEEDDVASIMVQTLTRTIVRMAMYVPAEYLIGASLSAAVTLGMGRPIDPKQDGDVRDVLKTLLDLIASKRAVLRSDATSTHRTPDKIM
jgi:hypothetical protein